MERPNILVIMADQMKATASHLYGNPFCETPALARLAAEGVLFQHAITPHPLCVPARVSLWTSQYPHATGARRNETLMPAEAWHAFKLWHAQGYHCALIGKNHCFTEPADLALFSTWCEIAHGGIPQGALHKGMPWFRSVEQIARGHSVRRAMPTISPHFSYAATDFPLEDYSTGLIAGQTERFLASHRDEPFALWVSFPDPHEPYETPRRYWEMFPPDKLKRFPARADEFAGPEVPERNRVLYQMSSFVGDREEDVRGVMAAYYGETRFVDDGVGQIIGALERLGLRERTLVVFCADHGDFGGEHNMMCKGGVFYDALTRVPLILSWPGHIAMGQRDESMVNLVDIVPTLLRLQGQAIPASAQGQPLPTITDAPPREAAFSEYGAGGPPFTLRDLERLPQPWGRRTIMQSLQWREAEGRRKMARTRRWKYVHDPLGDQDELYDLAVDPWELHNVAHVAAYRDALEEMRLRLADWSIATEDARPVPMPSPDKYRPV